MKILRRRRVLAASAALATCVSLGAVTAPALASHSDTPPADYGDAGDTTIIVPVNDSAAGGTYYQPFTRAYAGETADGTPVYVYVPQGALNPDGSGNVEGVHSLDPTFDHDPGDDFVPCGEGPENFTLTQQQVDYLGDQLQDQILRVNEDHFGDLGAAASGSDALVTLVYNVQDDAYYNCDADSYTAGYFAPEYLSGESLGMNVMVIDALDWANRVGDPATAPWSDGDTANDRPELYEGVVAHELEHMLMNYSDSGELSWVDEGLADMAAFLNDYDMTGSHLTYQQVFHRETSLTRWGGGLENYGASFSYFLYLWEQAGGNGTSDISPDLTYNGGQTGDALIKLIFAEQADGMEGVQNAIDTWNASGPEKLESATELFKDWAVAMYLDDEGSPLWDLQNIDLGPGSDGWTIDIANEFFWDNRGSYRGAQPQAKWDRLKNRPAGSALPFGVSYEKLRNPGPKVQLAFEGEPTAQVAPHTGETHWWGGYQSQSDHELGLDTPVTGGETVSFWNWHFIEEGWDYGFVEALVEGEWVTVPVRDESGAVVSTNEDPHGGNTEGNGITGTSGGEYFVDEPTYQRYSITVPEGATDVRWRYSTDAAYLDTGWFIDDVTVDEVPALVSSEGDEWIQTDGKQTNNWTLQVLATCDLTPGVNSPGEIRDGAGNWVYRYDGSSFRTATLNTRCANGTKTDFVVAVSNLPTGDLSVLDASYDWRVIKKR
jgi:hypothetical protein